MICKDCEKQIGYMEHRESMDAIGVELCSRHTSLIRKIIREHKTPVEAIQLFYALMQAGASPMLEWWNGKKSIDIAISRVKLNIEVEQHLGTISHEQAIKDLEEAMNSFKDGFTTLKIPYIAITHRLEETVDHIMGIVAGLKKNIKAV